MHDHSVRLFIYIKMIGRGLELEGVTCPSLSVSAFCLSLDYTIPSKKSNGKNRLDFPPNFSSYFAHGSCVCCLGLLAVMMLRESPLLSDLSRYLDTTSGCWTVFNTRLDLLRWLSFLILFHGQKFLNVTVFLPQVSKRCSLTFLFNFRLNPVDSTHLEYLECRFVKVGWVCNFPFLLCAGLSFILQLYKLYKIL